jgi:S1-C subfamily serine protease
MKRVFMSLTFAFFLMSYLHVYADQDPNEVLRAIVKIRSIIPENARTAQILGREREGSGVVIDSEGHVLTIGYLILEAETIEIVGSDGKPVRAQFVAYDHRSGFGLLRSERSLDAPAMTLGRSSEIEVGDPVLVAGHGGTDSVQGARIIARQEFAGSWEYLLEDALFTSPPYSNFGGAALISRNSRLIGIGSLFTQVVIPGFGPVPSNMFVPIDHLKSILNDLINTGRSRQPPRPWLGLNVEEIKGRVFVQRVSTSGPAEKAGLQQDDIILMVDKATVKGLADYYRQVWALGQAGVDVPLSVLQGAKIRDIIVQSADRDQYMGLRTR